MRLYIVFLILIMMPFAHGLKSGVVVDVQGDVYKGCVSINSGDSAYTVLDKFNSVEDDADIKFDGGVLGTPHFLKSVNGIEGASLGDNKYSGWNFWVSDNDNSFKEPPELAPGWGMGVDDYKITSNGDVIGINFGTTAFNSDWTVKTMASEPSYVKYSNLCENLDVKNIKVYVDGKKESGVDEDGGKIDVIPGSTIELKVELENLFTDDQDVDINDILIEAVLESIDDGDDIEIDVDEFDLNAEEDKKRILEFKVPFNAEESQYDLILNITGDDDRGVSYSIEITFEVDVERENHNIAFNEILTDANLACDSQSSVGVDIVNLGSHDEDVRLTIFNDDLELNDKYNFNLEMGEIHKKDYIIKIPDKKTGVFQILVSVDYNDDKDKETEVKKVNVECVIEGEVQAKNLLSANIQTNTNSFKESSQIQPEANSVLESNNELENKGLIISLVFANILVIGLIGFAVAKFLV